MLDDPRVACTARCFARGDRISDAAGCPGHADLHLVRSGIAAASAWLPDGRRQILCFLAPGDVICPFGVGDAECWAEAVDPVETWMLSLSGAAHRAMDPALATTFFGLAHTALERALAHSVVLGRYTGPERLAAFLADLARRTGWPRGAGLEVMLPMSREDIADHLGLNADTVSRLCSRLKGAGLVRFPAPSRCEIPDLAALEATIPLGLTALAPPIDAPRGGVSRA